MIIYTTAYDQYAINAFEQASIDYLLKPYPLSRLKAAIEKAHAQWVGRQQIALSDHNADLHSKDVSQSRYSTRLVSKLGDRISLIESNDIQYITSEQSTTFACVGSAQFILSDTLNKLSKDLASNKFVRVHRSYIVNIDKIKEIERWFNGKLMLIMQDGKEISTSRAGALLVKQLLRF